MYHLILKYFTAECICGNQLTKFEKQGIAFI